MRNTILFLLLVLPACGPYKLEVEQKNPLVVEHQISVKELKVYFEAKCLNDNPSYTDEELDQCVALKIADFLDIIGGA